MKILAINGSPRKKWNTAALLEKALAGAASKGAETELIHLYDLNFKGCISCFACKLKGGKSYGKCAVKDDLTPVLEKIANSDGLILGSPIYFGNVTGEMRSFIERALFPYGVYDETYSSLFPKKIPVGFIYTMNIDEKTMAEWGYAAVLKGTENAFARLMGSCEAMYVTDTYQFDNYDKYVATRFDAAHKAKRRDEEFPKDCNQAFEMGVRFAVKKT